MMTIFHEWVISLTAAAVLASIAMQLTPKGSVRSVTGFVCGVMLLGVLIEPLWEADFDVFSDSLNRYRSTVSDLTATMEEQEKELLRTYIEEKYAAYILDEAHVFNAEEADAKVIVKWRDESWVPYEAYLVMRVSPETKQRLMNTLITQLGIPEERQHWNVIG